MVTYHQLTLRSEAQQLSEIWIKIHFCSNKMHLKISSAKWSFSAPMCRKQWCYFRMANGRLLRLLISLCYVVYATQGLDNGLARTPPMGWLSWLRFECNTDCRDGPDDCIGWVTKHTWDLTHLPLDKMAAISQTLFSDAFSWMKSFVLWSKFHWSLFLRVQLTIIQHWFR